MVSRRIIVILRILFPPPSLWVFFSPFRFVRACGPVLHVLPRHGSFRHSFPNRHYALVTLPASFPQLYPKIKERKKKRKHLYLGCFKCAPRKAIPSFFFLAAMWDISPAHSRPVVRVVFALVCPRFGCLSFRSQRGWGGRGYQPPNSGGLSKRRTRRIISPNGSFPGSDN